MASVTNKQKWNEVYPIWSRLEGKLRADVQGSYTHYYNEGCMTAENAMEAALIDHGVMPPPSMMEGGAQEYDEIQRGEEIWVSIQKNSGT